MFWVAIVESESIKLPSKANFYHSMFRKEARNTIVLIYFAISSALFPLQSFPRWIALPTASSYQFIHLIKFKDQADPWLNCNHVCNIPLSICMFSPTAECLICHWNDKYAASLVSPPHNKKLNLKTGLYRNLNYQKPAVIAYCRVHTSTWNSALTPTWKPSPMKNTWKSWVY